jgi:hypothetical protein
VRRIGAFDAIVIEIYFGDHPPPRFYRRCCGR